MKTSHLLYVAIIFFLSNALNGQGLEIQIFQPEEAADSSWRYQFAEDQSGTLWAGNENGQLFYFENNYWQFVPIPHHQSIALTDLKVDAQNRLWISTNGNGLYCKNGEIWQHWHIDNSDIASDSIAELSISPEGLLWLRYENSGLGHFDGNSWFYFDANNAPLPGNQITALLTLEGGDIWLATPTHLVNWGNEGWDWFPLRNITGFAVTEVLNLRHQDGALWLSSNVGLYKLVGEEWLWVSSPLDEERIVDCTIDEHGILWFCESGFGMHRVDSSEQWMSFVGSSLNQIPIDISELFTDQFGRKWMGTSRGGICLLHNFRLPANEEHLEIAEDRWISPNPVVGELFVGVDSEKPASDALLLYDFYGRLIKQIEQSKRMDLSNVPAGKYWLQIVKEEAIYWKPVIKVQP